MEMYYKTGDNGIKNKSQVVIGGLELTTMGSQ